MLYSPTTGIWLFLAQIGLAKISSVPNLSPASFHSSPGTITFADLRGCLDAVECLFVPRESDTLVVSASIFRYLLQVSRPFLYMHLMVYGRVAYGQDVLSGLQPLPFTII